MNLSKKLEVPFIHRFKHTLKRLGTSYTLNVFKEKAKIQYNVEVAGDKATLDATMELSVSVSLGQIVTLVDELPPNDAIKFAQLLFARGRVRRKEEARKKGEDENELDLNDIESNGVS